MIIDTTQTTEGLDIALAYFEEQLLLNEVNDVINQMPMLFAPICVPYWKRKHLQNSV